MVEAVFASVNISIHTMDSFVLSSHHAVVQGNRNRMPLWKLNITQFPLNKVQYLLLV